MQRPLHRALSPAEERLLMQLQPELQQLWTLCDGQHDLQQLAQALNMSDEQLFMALDQLADAKLITHRAAPPTQASPALSAAMMGRRQAIGRIAASVGVGLVAGGFGLNRALAQDTLQAAEAAPTKAPATTQEADSTLAALKKNEQEKAEKAKVAHNEAESSEKALKKAQTCQEESAKAKAEAKSCPDVKRVREEHLKRKQVAQQKHVQEEQAKREVSQHAKRQQERQRKTSTAHQESARKQQTR